MFKLAILHYLPLEYYPPVTNLIDYIANERSEDFKKVKVYSCHNTKGRNTYRSADREINKTINPTNKLSTYRPNDLTTYEPTDLIKLIRSPFPKETDNSLIRLLKYLHYNLVTLIGLITYRPGNLLYYESYSVWPAFIYTRYFNRKCRIYIHNHEYALKEWYTGTMKQVRYFHQLEKRWLYPRAQWISQTNADRLQFFHQDHPNLKKEQLKIMPNYPPKRWNSDQRKGNNQPISQSSNQPIKLIYVGSLSFQSTYLKELCEWVLTQNGKIQFDVYAYNLYEDVKEYLKTLHTPYINYYAQGIEYNDQPKVLIQYDVGLILYKAHNQNYTYNAPNKLFEYLACGLDVWYPSVLKGPQPYNTKNTYPKVLPVNFEQIASFDYQKAIDKTGMTYKPSEYFCESIYKDLVEALKGK